MMINNMADVNQTNGDFILCTRYDLINEKPQRNILAKIKPISKNGFTIKLLPKTGSAVNKTGVIIQCTAQAKARKLPVFAL